MNAKKLIEADIPIYGDATYRGPCPVETAEQISFLAMLRKEHPELAVIAVHIRNEGKRTKQQAVRHKAEGMNTGASDIVIPCSPPILIELKRRDHTLSAISIDQIAYLQQAIELGAFGCVALGAAGAMEAVRAWAECCK